MSIMLPYSLSVLIGWIIVCLNFMLTGLPLRI
ncbi:AbgT family transporter [Enterococcus sp. BWM-S5]|uniref:AbgT family transporter n=1 Tax=Enterococcus larvae TaxID=2794352 RepID=A0ABS4CI50_9ENTE|nr:AbgT family transporter [Enterococcus larvae]